MAYQKKQDNKTKSLLYSLEAEQAILGCIIIGNSAIGSIFNQLKAEDFYSGWHKMIFEAMYNIHKLNKPIDYVTLISELENNGNISNCGGIEYIAALSNIVPSSANYQHYLDIVLEKSKLNKILNKSQKIIDDITSGESLEKVLTKADTILGDIEIESDIKPKTFEETAKNIKNKLIDIMDNGYVPSGVPIGYKQLSHYLESFQKGQFYLICARPSLGKTAFMLNILTDISVKQNYKSLLFSLEMTQEQNIARIMANMGDYSSTLARIGGLPKEEKHKIETAYNKIKNASVIIDDKAGVSIEYIKNKARAVKTKIGLDIVFIDHMGLISAEGENRTQIVSNISRSMKILAKDLNVPVVCLMQLNRAVEMRENKEPQLSDIRDSGAIEQDADMVLFLQRLIPNNNLTSDDEISKRPSEIPYKIIIAKQRDGMTGYVDFFFYPMRQRFIEKKDIINKPKITEEPKLTLLSDSEIEKIGDVFENEKNDKD